MKEPADYNNSVFVNCPFDDDYQLLFRAMIFTIYRCGFTPKSALAEDDGLDNRIDKLTRIIEHCRYGIHDISRTELNAIKLPRFNMPFELGIYYGAKRFGNKIQKGKSALVLEREKYLYQKYISDINGVDTKAHENDPATLIRKVRDWLKTQSKRTSIPGSATIIQDYGEFVANLPAACKALGFDEDNILFNDFCTIVEESIRAKQQFQS